MTPIRLAFIGFAVAASAGCAGPSAGGAKARSVVYNTSYTNVWNAVEAEMHERFTDDGIRVEDVQNGVIISKWKAVASSVTSEDLGQTDTQQVVGNRMGPTGGRTAAGISGDMVQIRVKVVQGGPPWRVLVDAEAAHRSPDTPMLKPYRRGGEDEPAWVQAKIDSTQESIYERLKTFAVAAAPSGTAPPQAPPSGEPPAPEPENSVQAPPPAK